MELSSLTVDDLSPVRKRLRVEIPAAAVQAELDRAFLTIGRQARLPGFRPGKAPRVVLERMFGEQVRREVLTRLVEQSFRRAVESRSLDVVGTPDIDAETLMAGTPLRYSATVDVRPAIAVGDLAGFEAERPAVSISEDDVDRVLAGLRESAARLRPIEDRAVVEAGDVVQVDLTSRMDRGEATRRDGVLVEAGTGSFPLALERQLVGQHRGARLGLRVPYPPDYSNASLAGKTVEFEVEIKDLRAKELPPLDDDLARDHGRCESLVELRERIRADLERQGAERAEARVHEMLVDQLLARHPFEVPASLVSRRCDTILASLDLQLPEGADGEAALERLRAEVRPRAEREVRIELLLDAIAAREGLTVTDEEVAAQVGVIATGKGQVPERVRAFYERPEARAALHARLLRERSLAHLVAHAKIVPGGTLKEVAHGR